MGNDMQTKVPGQTQTRDIAVLCHSLNPYGTGAPHNLILNSTDSVIVCLLVFIGCVL